MSKTQSGSIDLWVIVALVLVISVAGFAFYRTQIDDQDAGSNEELSQTDSQPSSTSTGSGSQEQPTEDDKVLSEEISLEGVGRFDAEGTATRKIGDKFTHSVRLLVDDPEPGKFYEGWLVGPSIISTGKLEKIDGVYTLNYESDDDLSNHNNVVITSETESLGLDGNPEEHVAEGSF